jgi:hypothetical protein
LRGRDQERLRFRFRLSAIGDQDQDRDQGIHNWQSFDLNLDLDLLLRDYVHYYNTQRTQLGIGKDSPEPREVQAEGEIEKIPAVGGLHHYYYRRAA